MSVKNELQGVVTITEDEVLRLCAKYVNLPAAFHVTLGRVRLDAVTGILTCRFNASTEGTPEVPPDV